MTLQIRYLDEVEYPYFNKFTIIFKKDSDSNLFLNVKDYIEHIIKNNIPSDTDKETDIVKITKKKLFGKEKYILNIKLDYFKTIKVQLNYKSNIINIFDIILIDKTPRRYSYKLKPQSLIVENMLQEKTIPPSPSSPSSLTTYDEHDSMSSEKFSDFNPPKQKLGEADLKIIRNDKKMVLSLMSSIFSNTSINKIIVKFYNNVDNINVEFIFSSNSEENDNIENVVDINSLKKLLIKNIFSTAYEINNFNSYESSEDPNKMIVDKEKLLSSDFSPIKTYLNSNRITLNTDYYQYIFTESIINDIQHSINQDRGGSKRHKSYKKKRSRKRRKSYKKKRSRKQRKSHTRKSHRKRR